MEVRPCENSAMDALSFSRIAYPFSMFFAGLVAVLLPAVRLFRRTGTWPFTGTRNRDPTERRIQILGLACALAFVAWAVAYAAFGPQALGVWPLPVWTMWAGWTLAVLGLAVVVTAQAQMGASWRIGIDADASPLILAGLFRFVRNPIYSGLCVFGVGLLLVSPSPWLVVIALTALIVIQIQTRREEKYLLREHGEAFAEWAGGTGRFMPWVGRLRRR